MAINPEQLLRAFERLGYQITEKSDHNWFVELDGRSRGFSIPRRGRYVAADVLAEAMKYEPLLSP